MLFWWPESCEISDFTGILKNGDIIGLWCFQNSDILASTGVLIKVYGYLYKGVYLLLLLFISFIGVLKPVIFLLFLVSSKL